MNILLNISDQVVENGLKIDWENGFIIKTKFENGQFNVIANKEGLISLAKQLLTLAQDTVPSGQHFHYDDYNSLEDGSTELIIQKM